MGRRKKILITTLCVLLCSIPMQAAGYYKSKQVQYGGANFYYNGVYQGLSSQMVTIDGAAYMPANSLFQLLGLTSNWDTRTQTLRVSGNVLNSNMSMQAELQAKNDEIASLKKELEKYRLEQGIITSTSGNNISATTGANILPSDLVATRKALESEYSLYFDDIEFDFSLSLSSGKIKVIISYDSSSENKAFNNLSSKKVKEFLEEVCETIRDYHEDIVIEGRVQYRNSIKTPYSFSYSKRDVISFSNSSSYENITRSEIIDIVEDTTSVRINGYSGRIEVTKVDASVDDSRERVTYKLYLSLTDEMKAAWSKNTGTDNDKELRSYLRDIAREISDETNYEILGQVYTKDGSLIAKYDYEDNEIIVYSV